MPLKARLFGIFTSVSTPIVQSKAWPESLKIPMIIAALVTLCLSCASYYFDTEDYHGASPSVVQDMVAFNTYREGTTAFTLGDHALYTSRFVYPPTAAFLFAPYRYLSPDLAKLTLLMFTLAWLFGLLYFTVRAVDKSLSRSTAATIAAVATPISTAFQPVQEVLNTGDVSIVLAGFIAADLLAKKLPFPRGILLGMAICIKFSPAAFLLIWFLTRNWRALFTSVAIWAGLTSIVWLWRPMDSRDFWLELIWNQSVLGDITYVSNQSLGGMLARHGMLTYHDTRFLVLGALAVALTFVGARRAQRYGSAAGMMFVVAFGSLLLYPVSWTHHWVWLCPVALALGWTTVKRFIWASDHKAEIGLAEYEASSLSADENNSIKNKLWSQSDSHGMPAVSEAEKEVRHDVFLQFAAGIRASTLTFVLTIVVVAIACNPSVYYAPHGNHLELGWPVLAHLTGNSYFLLGTYFLFAMVFMPQLFAPTADVNRFFLAANGAKTLGRVTVATSALMITMLTLTLENNRVMLAHQDGLQALIADSLRQQSHEPVVFGSHSIPVAEYWSHLGPIGLWAVSPFTWWGYQIFTLILIAAAVAALWVSYIIIWRSVNRETPKALISRSFVVLLPVILLIDPIRREISGGNTSIVITALIIADLMVIKPSWPRGTILGVVSAIAGWPAVIIPGLLVSRQYRTFSNAVVWFCLANVVGALFWPTTSIDYMRRITDYMFLVDNTFTTVQNVSVAAALARAGVDPTIYIWLNMILFVLIIGGLACWARCKKKNEPLAAVILLTMPLYTLPIVDSAKGILCVPLLVLGIVYGIRYQKPVLFTLMMQCTAMIAVFWPPSVLQFAAQPFDLSRWEPWLELVALSPLFILGIALAVAIFSPAPLTVYERSSSWDQTATTVKKWVKAGCRALSTLTYLRTMHPEREFAEIELADEERPSANSFIK